MPHTCNGLVDKAILIISYHTRWYIIPLGTSWSFVYWSILINLVFFLLFSIHDVLKITMNDHIILFFKTYLPYAQLTHDQSSDNSSNNNLVITYSFSWSYSSSWSYQVYIHTPRWSWCQILHYINIFMHQPWIQHMEFKHGLWTNTTSKTQCNH